MHMRAREPSRLLVLGLPGFQQLTVAAAAGSRRNVAAVSYTTVCDDIQLAADCWSANRRDSRSSGRLRGSTSWWRFAWTNCVTNSRFRWDNEAVRAACSAAIRAVYGDASAADVSRMGWKRSWFDDDDAAASRLLNIHCSGSDWGPGEPMELLERWRII